MADCGICLDALRSPVSVPCGHVHCERCLRNHISTGADALKSTCPTCRKPFHIATPDFTFVPQKYHDFILPSVRKIYMDVPSVTALTGETSRLNQRIEALVKENEHLRRHYAEHKEKLKATESKMRMITEREEEIQQEVYVLHDKYESLKRKYCEIRKRDYEESAILSYRSSQNLESSQEILPKEEEHPVSLQNLKLNQSRPKCALPRSRLSEPRKDDKAIQLVKRQRTHRHSDVGPSTPPRRVIVKSEDEE